MSLQKLWKNFLSKYFILGIIILMTTILFKITIEKYEMNLSFLIKNIIIFILVILIYMVRLLGSFVNFI